MGVNTAWAFLVKGSYLFTWRILTSFYIRSIKHGNSVFRRSTRVSHRCWEHGELCPPDWGGGGSSKFEGGLKSIHGGAWGELKMLSKNTCEIVHLTVLTVTLPPISLQACKFTKNKLLHPYFSRILARF